MSSPPRFSMLVTTCLLCLAPALSTTLPLAPHAFAQQLRPPVDQETASRTGATNQGDVVTSPPVASLAALRRAAAAGEFSVARSMIPKLPANARDDARLELATALQDAGMTTAAADLLQTLTSPNRRIDFLRSRRGYLARSQPLDSAYGQSAHEPMRLADSDGTSSGLYSPNTDSDGNSNLPQTSGAGQGGAGGAAIADFDSLMQLIETTIAPDTWEAVGGPSTMAPYRAGIHVDPNGLVRDVEIIEEDRLAALESQAFAARTLRQPHAFHWTTASPLRWVSLKKLRQSLVQRQLKAQPPTAAMSNLAGLTRIQFVLVQDDDILLGGPTFTTNPAAQPWPRARENGRVPLALELLSTSAQAVARGNAYGCSIDPTQAGLIAAQQVAGGISSGQWKADAAADALADAMGDQVISLFDVAGDTPLAWLLVDADRHMKQLALGKHPMPDGVRNYLQIVESTAQQNPDRPVPSGQLLRLWFAAQPKQIRRSPSNRSFELTGSPIRLVSAKEFATLQGERVQAGEDELGRAYASEFTQHFADIARRYPVYDRLRGAFELTAAMELVKRTVGPDDYARLVGDWMYPDLLCPPTVAVPRRCESIAAWHTFRRGRQRHHVYVASGGVHVAPEQTLVADVETYASLNRWESQAPETPAQNTRWWWDQPAGNTTAAGQ